MRNQGVQLTDELTKKVKAIVKTVFPSLVAAQLAELSKEIKIQPERKRHDTAQLKANCKKLLAKGLSQNKIAGKLGISQGYVSLLLNGRNKKPSKPSKPYQAALAKHGSRTMAAAALNLPRQTFSDRLAKELAS